ncbi:MAG: oligosaccharide flippase family protein [Phycisphaerales bacterium]|nr:oligosaccharide flippase family protein [Phycisphaerales bacterium]
MSSDQSSKSLGSVVGTGMIWMLIAALATKVASFVSQIVLGNILIQEDFGIYALAAGVTVFVSVIRDGGARKVLVQKGVRRFDKLVCPVFWMALCFNLFTAGLLILAGPVAARIYDEPALAKLLMVISLGIATSTPGMIYRSKLAAELRYRELARFRTITEIARNLSLVCFALYGFGAMSFAWPFLVISLVEWVVGFWLCGPLRLFRSPRFRLWPKLFGMSYWMLVAAVALAVVNMGPYAIVGYFVPGAVLGVYYFASQLVLQINNIIAVNLQDVLLPALSSMNSSRSRQGAAVVRTVQMLAFISSFAAFGVASTASEIEWLFWGDKWVAAIPAIQWMCVFIPFRMLQSILEPAVLSQSNYKLNAQLMILQGTVIAVVAFVAGMYFSEPWQFAALVGGAYALSIMVAGAVGCKKLGVDWWGCVRGFAPSWAVGLACFLAVFWAKSMVATDTTSRVQIFAVLMSSGTVFVFLFAVACRVLLAHVLVDVISVLPQRVRGLAHKLTLLPSP